MIRVTLAKEPPEFDALVRQRGLRALSELVGDPSLPKRRGRPRKVLASSFQEIPAKKLPEYWQGWCLDQLRTAYKNICAYLGMRIHESTGAATVDHFLPKSQHQKSAYEWSNYRLATGDVNRAKGEAKVLDPFEIENGWFVLDIGDFMVKAADWLSPDLKKQVEDSIRALGLNDSNNCLSRARYHDEYLGIGPDFESGGLAPLPCWQLERECPFVYGELRRQGLLRAGDLQSGPGPGASS